MEPKPPLDSNEKSSQPEIEIPKEIPKSEPNIPSSVSNEETPVKEENNSDKRVENNNPPEVINEQSPAVIKSTKNESQDNSKNNSSQSMTSSQQDEPIVVEATPAKPPRTPSTPKPSDNEIRSDSSSQASDSKSTEAMSSEPEITVKSQPKPEDKPEEIQEISEESSSVKRHLQPEPSEPVDQKPTDPKPTHPKPTEKKSGSSTVKQDEKILEDIPEEKPGNGALKRGDNRKSKRISNKKPNYKDKVWKNISCLATEVDELENRHSPTPPKQKKNRKSFCTLQ